MLIFLLINVKMPTTVGMFTIMSRKNFMLNSVYNLGARLRTCMSAFDFVHGHTKAGYR